ncbi:family 20 glycosylhydrolase [Joostella sp.]|uniref:family 20 glycosylhydrolase n=1 Tax=Joostella sp. TaxID=2231138 RepID=UPI003A90025A
MNKILTTYLKLFFIITFINNACYAQEIIKIEDKYPIIPTPKEIDFQGGEISFNSINIKGTSFFNERSYLESFFSNKGINNSAEGLKIVFKKSSNLNEISDETYGLIINDGIYISAASQKGAYYAIQTLKQIFRINQGEGILPVLKIKDWPVFQIRGFLHDTGRNFQSIEQLKDQIEVLAQYKYNVFHWHLTDDPGWRLESKLYPQLQSEAYTSRNKGKYYTQAEFKDIISFCKERNITVIPEFDIPGHSKAFRGAMGYDSMNNKNALKVLLDLFDELCSLASPEEMPYIHIGTDEVRNKEEYVSDDFILKIIERIKQNNRDVIVWEKGVSVKEDTSSINQLWAMHEPRKGHRFIDSRANYINHLDPLAGMVRLFFQQPCRQPQGDSLALGGVLCAWPDNRVAKEEDILMQNPIYPSILFYSDAIWNGRKENNKEYWAKLPSIKTKEYEGFKAFEKKVLFHRDSFFKNKSFPYIKQSETYWNVIGPFNHQGDFSKKFPIEDTLKNNYKINGDKYQWSNPIAGGTIHFKHFFGFPALTEKGSGTYYAVTEIFSPNDRVQDFWIGFQGWSRSGGRRGGPFPNQGQWHTTQSKIWVNNNEIDPPSWKQPNVKEKSDEIPFIDEDYFYRAPTKIHLNKGWNKIVLKVPHGGNSWKWMFTCVPINFKNNNISEVSELKFRPIFNR